MTEPRPGPQCPFPANTRRAILLMSLAASLCVVLPFLFWRQTWFGRELTEAKIAEYLGDHSRPRRIQHAMAQISGRISNRDPSVRAWYPQIVALAGHPAVEIRTTVAWLMGQDTSSAAFHDALSPLLHDSDPMVRRNAALSLVRFRDDSGRSELVEALRPLRVRAPAAGLVSFQARIGQQVGRSTLLARIALEPGREVELRAPLPGRIESRLAVDGSRVSAGEDLVSISPDSGQVWEALRGLYLIGLPDDLANVSRYAEGVEGMPDRIQAQAINTAQAIRLRSEGTTRR